MITPAEFEDRMKKISSEEDEVNRYQEAMLLMCDTLRCNGYEAGLNVFKEMTKNG